MSTSETSATVMPARAPLAGMRRTRWVFLRLLALVYLFAFASLAVQVDGLFGANGISPVETYLPAIEARFGSEAHRLLPTLLWFSPTDGALHLLCGVGLALSTMLLFGVAPVLCLSGLFVTYLSLVAGGQQFLAFQWDALLLEVGFLSIFWAPWRLAPTRPSGDGEPPAAITWMLRWLLLRLMLLSGSAKLMSGDHSWRDLTALDFHYVTQPLPTWLGWWAHQLPHGLQAFSVIVMFAIELFVPLFILGPRRWRIAAGWALLSLQVLIALTGNYGFFNLLTAVLIVPLLDDRFWPTRFRRLLDTGTGETPRHRREWPRLVVVPLAFFVLVLSVVPFLQQRDEPIPQLAPLVRLYRWFGPYRIVNSYGLFAYMTTTRYEIVVEGSADGRSWLGYDFKWKPGELDQRPSFIGPHMPRLDWQMWFAALSNQRRNPWVKRFGQRLLAGEPDVVGLLALNPFPDAPPKFVRFTVFEYDFTGSGERNWWRRAQVRPYTPILERDGSD